MGAECFVAAADAVQAPLLKPQASCAPLRAAHVTCHMSHVTCHMSHVNCLVYFGARSQTVIWAQRSDTLLLLPFIPASLPRLRKLAPL